jgi:Caspase domain
MNGAAGNAYHRIRSWGRRNFLRLTGTAGLGALLGQATRAATAESFEDSPALPPGRAFVIAIDKTDKFPKRPLEQPIKDASEFISFLVKKGLVDPAFVVFLTNPPLKVPPEKKVQLDCATKSNILSVYSHKVAKWPDPGERLYFYYSGHGLRYTPSAATTPDTYAAAKDAMIPSNFDDATDAISVLWLLDLFKDTNYKEQFYFFDTCRKEIYKPGTSLAAGGYLTDGDVKGINPYQYIMYSSSPGQETVDQVGAFSTQLLNALKEGRGTSKVVDTDSKSYKIFWNRLADYLIDYFDKSPFTLERRLADSKRVIMKPEKKVWPAENLATRSYPFLVKLGPGDVPPVKLTLKIDGPDLDLKGVEVVISTQDVNDTPITIPRGKAKAQMTIDLPPREYNVQARAEGYHDKPYVHNLNLIKVETGLEVLEIHLQKGPMPTTTLTAVRYLAYSLGNDSAPVAPSTTDDGSWIEAATLNPALDLKLNRDALEQLVGADSRYRGGSIVATDPHATLEVCHTDGSPLKTWDGKPLSGIGRLDFTERDLAPGSYVANWIMPNQNPVQVVFDHSGMELTNVIFAENTTRAFQPPAPTAPSKSLPVAIEPQLPPVVRRQVKNVVVNTGTPADWLALPRTERGRSDFRFLFIASRYPSAKTAGEVTLPELRIKSLYEPGVHQLKADTRAKSQVSLYTHSGDPGPYVLSFRGLGDSIEFALTLVEGHTCDLVFQQGPDGRVRIAQFATKRHAQEWPAADLEKLQERSDRDRLQRVQDALQTSNGRLNLQLALAELEHIASTDFAAVAILLTSYLRSVESDNEKLAEAASNLAMKYPAVPDGHVAMARCLDAGSRPRRDDAAEQYRRALNLGLPMLQHFLEALWVGARRHDIKHERFLLLEEAARWRIPGLLWSAWSPPDKNHIGVSSMEPPAGRGAIS